MLLFINGVRDFFRIKMLLGMIVKKLPWFLLWTSNWKHKNKQNWKNYIQKTKKCVQCKVMVETIVDMHMHYVNKLCLVSAYTILLSLSNLFLLVWIFEIADILKLRPSLVYSLFTKPTGPSALLYTKLLIHNTASWIITFPPIHNAIYTEKCISAYSQSRP